MYKMLKHKDVVTDYLEEEEKADEMWKVDEATARDKVQCSPFGIIPRKGKPGKWRLIVNLSAPEGLSVNDGID